MAEPDKAIEVASNDLKPQESDEKAAELAMRVNDFCEKLEFDQVDAEYAQVHALCKKYQKRSASDYLKKGGSGGCNGGCDQVS